MPVFFFALEDAPIILAKNMQFVNVVNRLCQNNEQNGDNAGVELFYVFVYNYLDAFFELCEIDEQAWSHTGGSLEQF